MDKDVKELLPLELWAAYIATMNLVLGVSAIVVSFLNGGQSIGVGGGCVLLGAAGWWGSYMSWSRRQKAA